MIRLHLTLVFFARLHRILRVSSAHILPIKSWQFRGKENKK